MKCLVSSVSYKLLERLDSHNRIKGVNMAEMLFCRAVKGEVLNTLWTDYPYIIFALLIIHTGSVCFY